jgi:hypothetical protein
MKVKSNKKSRKDFEDAILIEDYKLVSALSYMGYKQPKRLLKYIPEGHEDPSDYLAYIYPNTAELRREVKHILQYNSFHLMAEHCRDKING